MRKIANITAGIVVAAAVSQMLISPADAAQDDSYGGMSKSSFIAAATELGYGDAARKAWGDEQAMGMIPVSEDTSPGHTFPAENGLSTNATHGAVTRYGTCSKTVKNGLGAVLMSLTVKKKWRVNEARTAVAPVSLVHWYNEGLFWTFEGILDSQDYFKTANGRSKGMHVSKRVAKFNHPVGISENRTIRVAVNAGITGYSCSTN